MLTCFSCLALSDDLDSANREAAEHILVLKSTLSNLDAIMIGLIIWSVALTLAVTIMVTVIIRRMWMIHTLSKEIAARSLPTTESEAKEKVVINVDGTRLSKRFSSKRQSFDESGKRTAVQAPADRGVLHFPDQGTSTS